MKAETKNQLREKIAEQEKTITDLQQQIDAALKREQLFCDPQNRFWHEEARHEILGFTHENPYSNEEKRLLLFRIPIWTDSGWDREWSDDLSAAQEALAKMFVAFPDCGVSLEIRSKTYMVNC